MTLRNVLGLTLACKEIALMKLPRLECAQKDTETLFAESVKIIISGDHLWSVRNAPVTFGSGGKLFTKSSGT